MFSFVEKCRICSSKNLSKYLNLGSLPLANNLVPINSKSQDLFFPLEVMLCNDCKLSQLTVVVDPKILFSEYSYRTSISTTFQKHFAELAIQLKQRFFQNPENFLIADIASNDGCLLQEFKNKGYKIAGIEPAQNLAKIANDSNLPTIAKFWDSETAKELVEKFGKPHIITATNVFAHVHDIHSFLQNVKIALHPDGMLIIEVPHALKLVEKNEFDTIYHEHLSYFLAKPLIELFKMESFEIFDIQKIPVHGGSIRVFAKFSENKKINVLEKSIQNILLEEKSIGLHGLKKYLEFSEKTLDVKIAFLQLIAQLKKDGKKIAGYGAAAKASTLLNYCGLGPNYISFICDDAPEKQNKCFMGNRIPIYPSNFVEMEKPDYLAIFAWTIAGEIIRKTRAKGFKGKYIIPMPFPKIVSSESEL